METETEIRCPQCKALAVNRYGKTKDRRQRFICLACGRQFVAGAAPRFQGKDRPVCPACGAGMHVYMREGRAVRFRCAGYPDCRTFVKKTVEESR